MNHLFKYLKLAINLAAIILLLSPFFASAHVLEINQGIGGVMHIDPEDDPIAGETAHVTIELKDKKNKLNIKNCLCKAEIIQNNKVIEIITSTSTGVYVEQYIYSFPYVFPSKGIYTINMIGESNQSGGDEKNFLPFKLSYDIRVERESNSSKDSTGTSSTATSSKPFLAFLGVHAIHIVLFGGAILASVVLIVMDKYQINTIKKNNKEDTK